MKNHGNECWFNATLQATGHVFRQTICDVPNINAASISENTKLPSTTIKTIWELLKQMVHGELLEKLRISAVVSSTVNEVIYIQLCTVVYVYALFTEISVYLNALELQTAARWPPIC